MQKIHEVLLKCSYLDATIIAFKFRFKRRKENETMVKLTLKAARVNAGFSQGEAATRLGISASTLGNWEKGISFPDAQQISAICELYSVSYDNLIFLR